MNLIWTLALTVFVSSTFATEKIERKIKRLHDQLRAIESLEFSERNGPKLLENVQKVTSLFTTAEKEKTLKNPTILSRFNALFGKFIDEIFPTVLVHSHEKAISNFAAKFVDVNELDDHKCDYSSAMRVKASQFLFVCLSIAKNDRPTAQKYDRVMQALIGGIEAVELPSLLEFFYQKMNISNFALPDMLFENESCGSLTFEMKSKCVERIFKKAAVLVKVAEAKAESIMVDLFYAIMPLICSISFNLDACVLESACAILFYTAEYSLLSIPLNIFFTAFKQTLVTRKGSTVSKILEIFFHPVFVERVVLNWEILTTDQVLTWERGIIYAFTLEKNQNLKLPFQDGMVFGKTAPDLFSKIEIVKKLLTVFGSLDCASKIELLLTVYDQLVFNNFPLEVFLKITDQLSNIINFDQIVGDPLKDFASVLTCLVFAQQFSSSTRLPEEIISTIIKGVDVIEIPAQWKEKFGLILHAQLPRVANFIIMSRYRICNKDLSSYLEFFLKYVTYKCADVVIALAESNEEFLEALSDAPELYQFSVMCLTVHGKSLNPSQLNISSSLKELVQLLNK